MIPARVHRGLCVFAFQYSSIMKGGIVMKLLKIFLVIILFALACESAPLIILALIVAMLVMKGSPKENANKILEKTKKIIND